MHTICERDRQTDGWTDGQTPDDMKDRAYTYCRAVETYDYRLYIITSPIYKKGTKVLQKTIDQSV